jgi:hypothetical protein
MQDNNLLLTLHSITSLRSPLLPSGLRQITAIAAVMLRPS